MVYLYKCSNNTCSFKFVTTNNTFTSCPNCCEKVDIVDENYAFVGTFHSFGLRVIRENYEDLGLTKNFTIIDSDDVASIIKKIMKDLDINYNEYSI